MIRLAKRPALVWLDLPLGVRVQARPLTTAIDAAGWAHGRREINRLLTEIRSRRDAGIDVGDLPNLDDQDQREGYVEAVYAVTIARASIAAWEGVLTEDGSTPAPVTPDAVRDLMQIPEMARGFVVALSEQLAELAVEGNGCAPSPAGSGAPGASTAEPAEVYVPPAPTVA